VEVEETRQQPPRGPGTVDTDLRAHLVLRHPAAVLEHVRLCLKHISPAYSVRSPPLCGEGLGVGVVRFLRRWRHPYLAASPPPHPSPTRGEGADRPRRPPIPSNERPLTPPRGV